MDPCPCPELWLPKLTHCGRLSGPSTFMNAAYQGRNAAASLQNLSTWIEHNDAIKHALRVVQQRCDELEDEINDAGLSGLRGDPEIDKARQTALAVIGELEEQLASARPSRVAVVSGIGW